MKQILIISGKGGTGKTVLTAAFASLAKNAVFSDCDVDAANLHLILNPQVEEKHEFRSGKTAVINKDLCKSCGLCEGLCRFSAIAEDKLNGIYVVDPISCEGCGFCALACPHSAIEMQENISGDWFVSSTRFGPFVHAKLGVAEENSGKLVSTVKQMGKELANQGKSEKVVTDGAPGIGCPVIASLSDVDCAIVVTEPSLSGIHDAKRVIKVAKHFQVPVKIVINKFDLNSDMAQKIESFAKQDGIEVVGKIPFDRRIVDCVTQRKSVTEHPDKEVAEPFKKIWEKIQKI
ncbi:MAG: P-loop NTPase [Candidatus Aceula meridiana]|nr:P-loop NTPase [Candidatus Aceula meridiana]